MFGARITRNGNFSRLFFYRASALLCQWQTMTMVCCMIKPLVLRSTKLAVFFVYPIRENASKRQTPTVRMRALRCKINNVFLIFSESLAIVVLDSASSRDTKRFLSFLEQVM